MGGRHEDVRDGVDVIYILIFVYASVVMIIMPFWIFTVESVLV